MVCREASLEFGQYVWRDQGYIPTRKASFYHFETTVSASIMLCISSLDLRIRKQPSVSP